MVARMGQLCFRYRWLVLVGFVVVMVGGGAAAGPVLQQASTTKLIQGIESNTALDVLQDEVEYGLRFVALIDGLDPQARETQRVLARAAADLTAMPGVHDVGQPLVAEDGRGISVTVSLAKLDQTELDTAQQRAEERIRHLAVELPGSTVRIGGTDIVEQQANDASQADLTRAELLSLPLTLLVLVFVFRGLLPGAVPILGTIATMTGGLAGLFAFSFFVDLDNTVLSVIGLLSLGLSIDYGLLLVSRYREELAAGHRGVEAVGRTWGTAGRTVLFSGLTIVLALSGLLLFDMPRLQAMGAAGISAALLAMVTALTFTAALLGVFGGRIKPSRRAVARATAGDGNEGAFFARLARFTQHRPAWVAAGAVVVLLALAAPALHMTVKLPDIAGLPADIESVQVAGELRDRYGTNPDPEIQVVARTDPATLDTWATRWRLDPQVTRVEPAELAAPQLSTVVIDVPGDGQSAQARALVERIRADRPPGVESWVTGTAAALEDQSRRIAAGLPLAIGVTLLVVFVLLFLMTGSLLVPLKAIVMNVLSLAATFGVLTAIFQDGWLSGALDTLTVGGLSPYLLVTVFAFAFAFSMDYEVFLLGRIKEYVDAGYDTDTAVRRGLQRSGAVLTSAALLMLIVFASFGLAKLGDIEQIGVGLFAAILIDATIVRCLLVPATMTLLGQRNWWAPGPLRQLSARFGIREQRDPADREALVPTR